MKKKGKKISSNVTRMMINYPRKTLLSVLICIFSSSFYWLALKLWSQFSIFMGGRKGFAIMKKYKLSLLLNWCMKVLNDVIWPEEFCTSFALFCVSRSFKRENEYFCGKLMIKLWRKKNLVSKVFHSEIFIMNLFSLQTNSYCLNTIFLERFQFIDVPELLEW